MTSSVGQALRKARTEQGVELEEVERVTKIRAKFLRAIEADRWEELPAPVYARSFLETYARYLGLDEEALVERYRSTVEGADQGATVPPTVLRRGSYGENRSVRPPLTLVLAGLVTAALAGLVIAVAVGGSDDGGDHGKRKSAARATAPESTTAPTTSTSTGTAPAVPGEVSLELRATADVWVCLVDSSGAQLVNGETLTANQDRGPFASRSFEMTFGNGSVEMTVDGEPVKVPALAEPLGYRVTPGGARRLDPGSQPSCT